MRRTSLALLVAVLAPAMAGCSGGSDGGATDATTTTPAVTGPESPTVSKPVTDSPQPLPTASPGITGRLTQGQAHFEVSGTGVNGSAELDQLGTGAIYDETAGIALSWRGTRAVLTLISDETFTGTRTTSSTLTLTFSADLEGRPVAFTSSSGECKVTIANAEEDEVDGSFTCRRIRSDEGVRANATGDFEASGSA